MKIKLKEVDLDSLSDLKVSYFIGKYPDEKYDREVLVIRFEGVYGFGSGGNSDAAFMVAVGKAGIHAFDPEAVIIDLADLDYQWGDMMDAVIGLGDEDNLPSVVIVGDKCREAIGTLCFGETSTTDATEHKLIFDSIEAAWEYVGRNLVADGLTPLHAAVKVGDERRVKELIDAGADVSMTDNYGNTPLHDVKIAEIARLLIDAGADVKARESFGSTPLHDVEDVVIARMLLDAGADPDARNKILRSPLYYARTSEMVKLLVDAGADIHARNRTTPLHHPKHLDVAEALIDAGIDVNMIDASGGTALDHSEQDALQFQHQADNLGFTRDADIAARYRAIAQLIRDHGGKRAEELRSETGES